MVRGQHGGDRRVRGQAGGDVSQEWRNIVRDHMKMFVYKPV